MECRSKPEKRIKKASLFHYAHFMGDVVYPDVIAELHHYDVIYRSNGIFDTIGFFKPMYESILNVTCKEVPDDEFDRLNLPLFRKSVPFTLPLILKFQTYMFRRFPAEIPLYSPVVLIRRGSARKLVDATIPRGAASTGSQRREISEFDKVHDIMKRMYTDVSCIQLEDMTIDQQMNVFRHATLIVCAHGAAMTNMLFCKQRHTTVVEVTCGTIYHPFIRIANELQIQLLRVPANTPADIQRELENVKLY
jgi:hypothetical protein